MDIGRPVLLALCLVAFSAARLQGQASILYGEVNLLVGYSNQRGWIGEGNSLKNSVGMEYLRRIANEYGDFLTLDVQARLSYDTSDETDERWAFELHNAWLDYRLGLGRIIRLGHFDTPFGLEPSVDTHSLLFQTLTMQDIGFKQDWGVGYRSGLGSFDYEVAVGIGSGMGIARRDGSYLLSGRIGTPRGRQLRYGLSGLYGRVLAGMPDRTLPPPHFDHPAMLKKRIGADIQYAANAFDVKGEATLGQNEDSNVGGGLLQIDYTLPTLQILTLGAQVRSWTDDLNDARRRYSALGLAASYNVTPALAARTAVIRDIENPDKSETRAFFQVYYYGR